MMYRDHRELGEANIEEISYGKKLVMAAIWAAVCAWLLGAAFGALVLRQFGE